MVHLKKSHNSKSPRKVSHQNALTLNINNFWQGKSPMMVVFFILKRKFQFFHFNQDQHGKSPKKHEFGSTFYKNWKMSQNPPFFLTVIVHKFSTCHSFQNMYRLFAEIRMELAFSKTPTFRLFRDFQSLKGLFHTSSQMANFNQFFAKMVKMVKIIKKVLGKFFSCLQAVTNCKFS